MATLRKQKVGQYVYWQIVESKRVNGKPRPVVVAHLGTAEKLLYRLTQGPVQKEIQSYSHGAVQLLWKAAQKLELPSLFSTAFSSQMRNNVSVGTTLLLASIHRALQPGSKRSFSSWAEQTTLPQLAQFNANALDSQHFWDQMDTVTEEQLLQVQSVITQTLFHQGWVSSKLLFYDLTNFFTFIDTTNPSSTLAQRGHNKQKRHDLRQFGLAQATTKEYLLPILSEVYEGNRNDHTIFLPFLEKVKALFQSMEQPLEEFTLVFDKGSLSKANLQELEESHLSYVTSYPITWQKELLAIPREEYTQCNVQGHPCTHVRCKKVIWGTERTLLLLTSKALWEGQVRGLNKTIEEVQQKLLELQSKLEYPTKKPWSKKALEQKIQSIVKGEYSKDLFMILLRETKEGHFSLDWTLNKKQYRWLLDHQFGKILLCTNREEWEAEDIISAYRGQYHIEHLFRHLKNPYHHSVYPQYHWTDQKIKVHTFVCILGLLLSQMLWQKAKEEGYEGSIESLLDRLTQVRQVESISISDLQKKPIKETTLVTMKPEVQKWYDVLNQTF